MKLERGFLRSRVARRIVALFVACTLLPIVATALLSYDHVRKLLFDQSYQHLAQLGESYAGTLYDRLWGVSLVLRQVASDAEKGVAFFRRVAVREDLHGRGHGRRLLEHAERFVRTRGFSHIVSYVDPSAVGFYERCGFHRAIDAGPGSSVLMRKAIADAR